MVQSLAPFDQDLSHWPSQDLGDWFVLRTKARQEKILANDLSARSLGVFLPIVKTTRYYGNRKATVDLPLFPGYVFLRGSNDEAYEADRTRRIAQIIRVHDQERIDVELQSLFLALEGEACLDPYPYLKEGVWVEVRSGPFQGIRGMIESRGSQSNLLILQVEMLGRAVSLQLDGALLDVIDYIEEHRPQPKYLAMNF
jgi:transcription antitermination factor NusG